MNLLNGLCHCGCGLPTSIAKKDRPRSGHVKGQSLRYIRGHATGKHEINPEIQAQKDLECRRRYKREQRTRLETHVLEYLATHPCLDCGEKDPVVLDFDHRDPTEKYKTISQIECWAYGINILKAEIAKCDVRCANCHRRRHYNKPLRPLIGNY